MNVKKMMLVAISMAILIGLTSCVPPRAIDNRFPCQKDKKDIYDAIEKIMKEEGLYFMQKMEAGNGVEHYTYSTGKIDMGMGVTYTTVWEYWYDETDKQVYTIPMHLYYNTVYSNGTTIYNDKFDGSFISYWNVRAKLENLCDCKAIVTFYQPSESMKEQSLGR